MQIVVRHARTQDVESVARLFDRYRQFYCLAPDAALAHRFIAERIARGDSTILVAERGTAEPVGFTQLYPTICSLSAASIFVLYDLYVVEEARRMGVAEALMSAARTFAKDAGAVRLELATAKTNFAAQALYESLGWERDDEFHRYSLTL